MGTQNSAPGQPVCLLDAENSHRCTEENPVVSYLKHLEDNTNLLHARRDFNLERFRKIGSELVSKAVLHESVSEGKCFQVKREKADSDLDQESSAEPVNWICEDDLDNYWESNCMVLYPAITTCMDELAILKHTGDAEHLEQALHRRSLLEDSDEKEQFFYDFDYLAQLFIGRCVKVDGETYCPSESVHVSSLDEADLARSHCAVFDDVVSCRHDLREALQGGSCLAAGQTYVCEEDIPAILSDRCISVEYQGGLGLEELLEEQICGRDLIDFLNGYPVEVPILPSATKTEQQYRLLKVVTGNDLEMVSAQCLLIDGFELCWRDEVVAKPFDFIDRRCKVILEDGKVHCLGPRAS